MRFNSLHLFHFPPVTVENKSGLMTFAARVRWSVAASVCVYEVKDYIIAIIDPRCGAHWPLCLLLLFCNLSVKWDKTGKRRRKKKTRDCPTMHYACSFIRLEVICSWLSKRKKAKQQQPNAHAKWNFMKPGEWKEQKRRQKKSDVLNANEHESAAVYSCRSIESPGLTWLLFQILACVLRLFFVHSGFFILFSCCDYSTKTKRKREKESAL